MQDYFGQTDNGGRSPSFLSPTTSDWHTTVPTGVVEPDQPDRPAELPLASPIDLGGLRKRLTSELGDTSTTLDAQSNVQRDMTVSASNARKIGIENQSPSINTSGDVHSSAKPEGLSGDNSRDFAGIPPPNGGGPSNLQDAVSNVDDGLDDNAREFIRRSPAGFHITDVPKFMQSSLKVPRGGALAYLANDHNPGHETAVRAYNLSREYDRICQACHTWYRVGEMILERHEHFQQFSQRPFPSVPLPDNVVPFEEMQKKGRCGPVCNKVMRRPRTAKELAKVCKEATKGKRRRQGWNLWFRDDPILPEGIVVKPASQTDQRIGIKIVFMRKEVRKSSVFGSAGGKLRMFGSSL